MIINMRINSFSYMKGVRIRNNFEIEVKGNVFVNIFEILPVLQEFPNGTLHKVIFMTEHNIELRNIAIIFWWYTGAP